MKLTTGAKLAIGLFILAALFFGIRKFGPQGSTTPTVATTGQTADTAKTATVASAATSLATPTAADFGKKFTFFPDNPENGKLRGVIEFGASGFNAFAAEIDSDKRWKLINASFDKSKALEGEASDAVVLAKLKQYIAELKTFGVEGKNIQFVMSSGAKMNPNTYKVKTALTKLGYVINAVTAEQEGQYGLVSAQPRSFVDKSYVIDIGSGNTKISWREGGQIKSLESYGAKYAQSGISDATVAADIAAKVEQVPQAQRQVCFIIGGAPFKMANKVREGKERYTTLAAPEQYQAGDDAKLKSGINIYKAVVQSSGTKQFVFDWESNFTIGYLINRQK